MWVLFLWLRCSRLIQKSLQPSLKIIGHLHASPITDNHSSERRQSAKARFEIDRLHIEQGIADRHHKEISLNNLGPGPVPQTELLTDFRVLID